MTGYPIVLDLSGRLVVVVGGGKVAVRKVERLLECSSPTISVVAPTMHPDMPRQVEHVIDKYRPEHLKRAFMVFAATDSSEANDAVVRDARSIGALVCRADVVEENTGDFVTPAMLPMDSFLMTVSTGGSPALSAYVRDELAQAIDPRWVKMAQAMKTLRPLIRGSLMPARRTLAFRELCTEPALDELTQGGIEQLKFWLRGKFPEFQG